MGETNRDESRGGSAINTSDDKAVLTQAEHQETRMVARCGSGPVPPVTAPQSHHGLHMSSLNPMGLVAWCWLSYDLPMETSHGKIARPSHREGKYPATVSFQITDSEQPIREIKQHLVVGCLLSNHRSQG